jgi:uncharacterized membrane protein (UPF0182 family)
LDQHGSKVVLGSVIMTPIGESLLYIQPMYVEQVQNGVPRLNDVVVVYNNNAYHSGSGSPSLDGALCDIANPGNVHPFASYCAGAPTTTTAPPTTTGHKKGQPPPKTVPSTTTTSTSTTLPSASTSTTLGLPSQRASLVQDLNRAEQDFAYADAALKQGDLATYQNDIRAAEANVALATRLATTTTTTTTSLSAAPTSSTTTSTATTTTTKK